MMRYFSWYATFLFHNFSLSIAADFLLPISSLLYGMRYHGFIK